nr:MAG TPA: hypothetical protein [Caudoviricetes sp.]
MFYSNLSTDKFSKKFMQPSCGKTNIFSIFRWTFHEVILYLWRKSG